MKVCVEDVWVRVMGWRVWAIRCLEQPTATKFSMTSKPSFWLYHLHWGVCVYNFYEFVCGHKICLPLIYLIGTANLPYILSWLLLLFEVFWRMWQMSCVGMTFVFCCNFFHFVACQFHLVVGIFEFSRHSCEGKLSNLFKICASNWSASGQLGRHSGSLDLAAATRRAAHFSTHDFNQSRHPKQTCQRMKESFTISWKHRIFHRFWRGVSAETKPQRRYQQHCFTAVAFWSGVFGPSFLLHYSPVKDLNGYQ
jgi:hypothetical protein